MPSRTYYVELDGGFLDSDIASVRRKAIDHLWNNRSDGQVIIYTNATMKREVGRVIYTGSWPIFLWKPATEHSVPLRMDGYTRRNRK